MSVVVLVTASSLSCGGETRAEGGAGGTPPVSATGGTGGGNGGAGPRDAGGDLDVPPSPVNALLPYDAPLPIGTDACPLVTVEPISAAAPCTYPLPVPDGGTIDTKLNVLYLAGDQSTWFVAQNGSATCDLGWHFIDDQTRIEICGSTCDIIRTDPGAQLEMMFACKGPLVM